MDAELVVDPTYVHHIDVRYGEVDQQGVVFNAHYLAYVDHAMDCWLRSLDVEFGPKLDWDPMVKKAEIEWHGPAGVGERLDVACRVERWGTTSFTVRFDLTVAGAADEPRPVVTARVVYVGVRFGTSDPTPTPPEIVELLQG